MKFINIDNVLFYNGSQLSDEWIRQYSQDDHVILSFSGPCHVDDKYMVDLQDLEDKCSIMSERMLHFIIKHTSFPLPHIVFVQRLFIARIQNILLESFDQPAMRSGDDLFVHHSNIVTEGFRTLNDGQKVEFETAQGKKGLEATEVKPC